MKNLGLNITLALEMEENLKLIVKECDGLSLQIKNVAERLRGVDDINECSHMVVWVDSLSSLPNWSLKYHNHRYTYAEIPAPSQSKGFLQIFGGASSSSFYVAETLIEIWEKTTCFATVRSIHSLLYVFNVISI
uniref:Uncharacterized protein n=1 Tax=Davidia involucrata TaxID=16924 RepID=A0A5B7C742_DAVIN